MRIERVEIAIVELPLIRTFVTSSSVRSKIAHLIIRVDCQGIVGWGESASPIDPYYCPETTETCRHLLNDFLVPKVLGREWESIAELVDLFAIVKGNNFAKAGLEMACWDALAKSRNRPLWQELGGTRRNIVSGVSLGIERDVRTLLEQIDQYVAEGYARIKLKIKPGWDVEVVEQVRKRYPDVPLQVDANSAYTLEDIDRLKALDDFQLLLIEQPLAHDDIIDHAKLQAKMQTPICLDESIHSAHDARKALEIGACRVINIKVSRVGGLAEAKAIHDLCVCLGVPVWCGGMHEFGIGRAANLAISSLPGFVLPGDVSGSDKYYYEDIVDPPILADHGVLTLSDRPGIGFTPLPDRIERATTRKQIHQAS